MRFNVVNPFNYWIGFILIQFANFFFATGQVLFKQWNIKNGTKVTIYSNYVIFFDLGLDAKVFFQVS